LVPLLQISKKEQRYEATWVPAHHFTEAGFVVNSHMLTDHFPDRIIAAMEKLLSQQRIEGVRCSIQRIQSARTPAPIGC
jgi:hypothetical protein